MSRNRVLTGILSLSLVACAALEELVPGAPLPVRTHDGVSYRAETREVQGGRRNFETTATFTNATTSRREIGFPDGCVVLVRAYRNAARSGAPAWDQARAVGCTQALVEVSLPAGGAESRSTRFEERDVLGDSLPDGRYYLTAYLRPGNTTVEVVAGEVDLRR